MLKKAGFIEQGQKEQILKATDIVQLIGGYVQLKASGKNYLGLCPFHQEKTPSFTVSPAYQNYKCYGCGEYGDAIRFIMGMENLQFVEAVYFLADRCGIEIKSKEFKAALSSLKTESSKCLKESFDFFRTNLIKSSETSSIKMYLQQRSISDDLVDKFQLGYVGPGWTNLHETLLRKKISIQVQESAGLIKKGDKGGYYDRLRNRLVFPIHDAQNRLLGFAGRALGDDMPKYLNPPETELYKKSQVFYGINEAREMIRKKRQVIIVEGYLDAIRLHEHSWSEAIATCGTSITDDHIKVLKRFGVETVILLFDGDVAGIKAADRSARLFLANDMDGKVVVLPDGLDPDDYFKKFSREDFETLLNNAQFDYEFIIGQTEQETASKGIENREKAIRNLLESANGIKSQIKRDLFLSKAAEKLGINKKGLATEIYTSHNKKAKQQQIPEGKSFIVFEKKHLPEVKFLNYLIRNTKSIVLARKKVSHKDFINEKLSKIYARFLQLTDREFMMIAPRDFPEIFVEYGAIITYILHNESEYRGPAIERPSSEEMASLAEENKKITSTFREEALNHLILRLKKNKRKYEIKDLQYTDSDRTLTIVEQFVDKRLPEEKIGNLLQNKRSGL